MSILALHGDTPRLCRMLALSEEQVWLPFSAASFCRLFPPTACSVPFGMWAAACCPLQHLP